MYPGYSIILMLELRHSSLTPHAGSSTSHGALIFLLCAQNATFQHKSCLFFHLIQKNAKPTAVWYMCIFICIYYIYIYTHKLYIHIRYMYVYKGFFFSNQNILHIYYLQHILQLAVYSSVYRECIITFNLVQ